MTGYDYKVVPAPRKARKIRRLKTPEARFAHVLQEVINEHAADGWEFQRVETLPVDERQGLTSTQTVFRDLLVFRRPHDTQRTQAQESVHAEAPESADTTEPPDDDPDDDITSPAPDDSDTAPDAPSGDTERS
ncbi:MAG: hypothetical protein HLUCCO07_13125 [Rhodobacteraceae bacterium HLUCCO07]|nr:MAG: hypothetical protein HLUCCO07_13125 [Rhodobacteraceae bacterium HLUCCO07]